VYRLSDADLNALKRLEDVATGRADSHISFDYAAVRDMNGNNISELNSTQVDIFVDDSSAGNLTDFSLDMEAGLIALTFTETMNITALTVASQITLQSAADGTASTAVSLTLTDELANASRVDSTVVFVALVKDDLDAIKLDTGLCTSLSNCFISMTLATISDQNGVAMRPVEAATGLAATAFDDDDAAPTAVSYILDMEAETLLVSFSEPILVSSMATAGFGLKASASGTPYQLDTGTATAANGLTITISLQPADVVHIKSRPSLGTDASNSVLHVYAAAIEDMNENLIATATSSVVAYTPDTTNPRIVSFTFSIDATATLTINFDEVVNGTSLNIADYTLQSRNASNGENEVTLADSSVNAFDVYNTSIRIELTQADTDRIKTLQFCTSTSNCYLVASDSAVFDMVDLGLVAVADGLSMPASTVTGDTTRPALVAVSPFISLDYNTAGITLSFTEPVIPASINVSALRLVSSDPSQFSDASSLYLTSGTLDQTPNATILLTMSDSDLNNLKLIADLCTRRSNCYLILESSFIEDAFGNQVADRASLPAAQQVILDTTAPEIVSYTLDLTAETLSITFDEPVQVSSFSAVAIRLMSTSNIATAPDDTVFLTANNRLQGETDGLIATLPLNVADMIAINANANLCVSTGSCFLSVSSALIQDVAGSPNFNSAIATSAGAAVQSIVADTTSPNAVSFLQANLQAGRLTLSFNDAMNASSVDFLQIRIQSDTDATASYTLQNQGTVTYADSALKTVLVAVLHADDLETIQLDTSLMTSQTNTFVHLFNDSVDDMAGNGLVDVTGALQTAEYLQQDRAEIETLSVDLNDGVITFRFTAAVNTGTLAVGNIQVQSTAAVTASGGDIHALTAGSTTNSSSGFVMRVYLSYDDLNAIRQNTNLATEQNTSFVSITSSALDDLYGNHIVSVPAETARRPDTYIADTTPPTITDYSFGLDTGILFLTFDEVVNVAAITIPNLFFASSQDSGATNFTLSDGTIAAAVVNDQVTITTTADDLNSIKAALDLFTNTSNAFLSFAAGTFLDTSGNRIDALTLSTGLQATRILEDSIGPRLTNYTLDMDAGTVTLNFDETVLPASFVPSRLALLPTSGSVSSYDLTGQVGTAMRISPVSIVVYLTDTDLNAIKADVNLAVDQSSTFIAVTSNMVTDATGNAVATTVSDVAASNYTADTTAPELTSFSVDMNASTISLTFSETVDPNTFTVGNRVKLLGSNASGAVYHLLRASSLVSTSNPSTTVMLSMSLVDQNIVKNIDGLYRAEGNSWVQLIANAVSDMASNAIGLTSAVAADGYIRDQVEPVMTAFSIDLDSHNMSFDANEPIDADSFVATRITLQAADADGGVSYTLTGGDYTVRDDGRRVYLTLTTADVDALNVRENFANNISNVYVSMTAAAFTDVASNPVTVIVAGDPLEATNYDPDDTRPTMVEFDFNGDTGVLTMLFDEIMDYSTMDVTGLRMQAAFSVSSGTDFHVFTAGSRATSTSDGRNVTVQLSLADRNILATERVGIAAASTHLVMSGATIRDMHGHWANALENGASALAVDDYLYDVTDPRLASYNISIDAGTITLSFTETVLVNSLDATAATLQSDDRVAKTCPCADCLDGEFLVADCTSTVDTQCQACAVCVIGQYETVACTDTSNSHCTACESCPAGTFMASYCNGTSATGCVDCDDASCISCNGPGECFECVAGKHLSAGTTCVDTCPAGTYAESTSAGSVCIPCDPSCSTCTGGTSSDCSTCPGVLTITPQDPGVCQHACLASNGFATPGNSNCQPCSSTCDTCFAAGADSCITCPSADGTALLDDNLHARSDIRECVAVCPAGSYRDGIACLPCSANCASCTAPNACTACVAGTGLSVEGGFCHVQTATLAAAALNAMSPTPQVAYPNGASTRGNQTCSQTSVTEFTFTNITDSSSDDTAVIVMDIAHGDLNIIKSLLDLAVDSTSTFLAFTTGFITDVVGNEVQVQSATHVCPDPCFGVCNCPADPVGVRSFTADTTSPELEEWDLDMDNGRLVLSFTETVDVGSWNVTGLALQSAEEDPGRPACPGSANPSCDLLISNFGAAILCTTGSCVYECCQIANAAADSLLRIVSLADAPITPLSLTELQVDIADGDLDTIKLDPGLAVDSSTSWASFPSTLVVDTNNNAIVAEPVYSAQQVANFQADVNRPVLENFALDMNLGVLTMTFAEAINVTLIVATEMTLQSLADSGRAVSRTLTGGDVEDSSDPTIYSVNLTVADLNSIKLDTDFGVSTGTTFLSLTSQAVIDNADNTIAALVNGTEASSFTEDATAPEVSAFGLDMDSGIMQLNFSETVNASSLDVARLTLINADGSSSFTLSASTKSTSNSHVLYVYLRSTADFDSIKALPTLCVDLASTRLLVATAALDDMNDNELTVVTSALPASAFNEDTTEPTLDAFALDMDAGTITLSFSEIMNLTSVDVAQFRLQPIQTATSADTVAFTTATTVPSSPAFGVSVTFSVGESDLNALKSDVSLATELGSSYLIATAAGAFDMNNNALTAIVGSSGLLAANFTADSTAPTIRTFSLNMHTEELTISFSEVVNATSVALGSGPTGPVQVQNTADGQIGDAVYAITSATTGTGPLQTLVFALTTPEANFIKATTNLGTDINNTFLSVAVFVDDMAGNNNAAIRQQSALQALAVVADENRPELESFDFLMASGEPPVSIVLTFSETVNITSFSATGITLNNAGGESFTLTGGSSERDPIDTYIITLTVDDADLSSLKASLNIGNAASNTLITLDSSTVSDEAGNPVVAVASPMNVTDHTVDITAPDLSAFTLDLSANKIILTFSEAVRSSSLNSTRLVLQNDASGAGSTFPITGQSGLGAPAANIIQVSLTTADVISIKTDTALATNRSNTYLSILSDLVIDEAVNSNSRIASTTALQAVIYTRDNIDPTVTGFDLNMTSGILSLTFSEVMRASTVSVGALTFQSVGTSSTASVGPGLDGSVSTENSLHVTVALDLNSANALRRNVLVATAPTNTYLSYTAAFVEDMDGNTVSPAGAGSGLAVTTFAADSVEPTVNGINVDMSAGTVTIVFDQPVNRSMLVVTALTMRKASTTVAVDHPLTGGVVSSSEPYDTEITVTLTVDDLNSLKRKDICNSEDEAASCFMAATADFVYDPAGNGVLAITNTAPATTLVYTPDRLRPYLIPRGFTSFDLNTGRIVLEFSETVNPSTFNGSRFTLTNAFEGATTSASLDGAAVDSESWSTTLNFSLSAAVLDEIKLNRQLCVTPSSCYIRVDAGGLADTSDNAMVATDTLGDTWDPYSFAQSLSSDTSAPELVAFSFNMDQHTLTLTYDEAVSIHSMNVTAIVLQSARGALGTVLHRRLSVDNGSPSLDGPIITISISDADINAVRLAEFFTSADDAFVSIEASAFEDMSFPANTVTVVAPANALNLTGTYTADISPPRITGFTFNLNADRLTMVFNEPIRPDSFNFSHVVIQSDATGADVDSSIRLSDGIVLTTAEASMTIDVILTENDIISIKADRQFGTSVDTTFLAVDEGVVIDTVGLSSVAIASGAAMQASQFNEDITQAVLQSFHMHMDDKTLLLTFDEIMNPATFDCTGIQLQDNRLQANAIGVHRLTSSTASGENGTVVVVDLSLADILAIGVRGTLMRDINSSFIIMRAFTIDDVYDRDVIAITDGNAFGADFYTPDTTPPTIVTANLDMSSAVLSLGFSEAVNDTSFSATGITIAAAGGQTSGNQTLTGGTVIFAAHRRSCTISIIDDDLDGIKLDETLGVSINSTYLLYGTTLVRDWFDVGVTASSYSSSNGALEATGFREDAVNPRLVSFGLNMDLNTISLSFNEPMKANSIQVDQFRLQASAVETDSATP
jgi:hypothetical protein